ncbi:MAG TPA: histidine kinase [Pyrinomonadaceae bacterium]|jgi:signal transduction histidine kinase
MQNRLTALGVTLAFWTFLALLFTPQTYLANLGSPTPLSVWQAFTANSVMFYSWAALTPLILWLGRRLPLERPRFWRNLIVLFTLAFPFAVLHVFMVGAVNSLALSFYENYQSPVPVIALIVGYGATNVMVYWGMIAVSQAQNYFNRYREREKSLALAQLQSLRTQLNPHFLFNTLNAISELVYESAEEAETTIGKLSELLRMTLKTEQAQEIPLHQELEFLRKYVEIQQTLLQERLKVCWRIAPETLYACVPNMILQPLVENAIRHGIAPRRSGGTLKIVSVKENNLLVLRVQDDGFGFNSERKSEKGDGIGLLNTRTRLKHLYGDEQKFTLEAAPGEEGVAAVIEIPFVESSKKDDTEDTHFNS